MRKLGVLVLVMTLLLVAVVGTAATKRLVFASAYAKEDHQTQSLLKFAELVKEKTNGEIVIDVMYGGVLGGERDVAEGIQLGSVDGAVLGGILQNFDPALAILEFPFLFKNADHIRYVMEGPIGQVINERMQEKIGMRFLGIIMRTSRELTTRDKPIYRLSDLKGLKIRVPEMKAHIETWKALGANPTPLAFPEVYTALQLGTVDGQENPIPVIYANKFYEVCRYLAMTDHLPGFMMIVINDKLYTSLPYKHRIALLEAAKEASLYNDKLLQESMDEIMKVIKQHMTITYPDVEEFRNAAKDVYKKFLDIEGFEELYLAIRKAGEKF
ncbi:MAG: TRAP transporter substrate-binding protein [Thermotogae bacterium]|nr:TRAP transporter substrate-binding protein [Thermotogota bacterium]